MVDKWRTIAFGQLLAEPVRNGIYKQKEFHGRGAKIVNMGELFAYPRLRAVPMKRVELSDSENDRFKLEKGDLLFARRSLVAEGAGKCSVVLEVSEPTTFESSIIRARPDCAKADSLFLYYFFNSAPGLHCLDTIRRQVAVAGITGSDLAKLEITLPPLGEQRAIGHILGSLDDKIELNRRMNQELEAMARALFKSWFVDFEPVRAKTEGRDSVWLREVGELFPDSFEESELGEIPTGWEAKPLDDWVCSMSGGTPSKAEPSLWAGNIPWISPKVMTSIHADEADAYVSRSAIGNGTRIAPRGSTLVMVRGMGLHEGVRVSQASDDVAFNQDVKALVGKSIDPDMLLFALLDSQKWLHDRVESSGHGTGRLPTDVLLSLRVVMPQDSAQRRLAQPIRDLNDRIGAARSESRTLVALRDTLLPKLIAGDLRLTDAGHFIEGSG